MGRWVALALFVPMLAASDAEVAKWVRERGGVVEEGARRVKLDLAWVGDRDAARLAELKDLESLDLSLTLISDIGMQRLKPLNNIRELGLYSVEHITDTGISYIRGWNQLRRLNLRGTDITDTSMEYVAGFPALTHLDVSYTQVTNNGLEFLPALTQLEEFSAGGNKISGVGLHALKALPRLKRLNLSGAQKRNSGTWVVTLADPDLETLGQLKGLESLNLGGLRVTDLGLVQLRGLRKLRELDLSRTEVSGSGLAVLEMLPDLERLVLWNSKRVDDAAIAVLSKLKKLTRLDLAGTAITSAGVETLRRANPKCEVSFR